MKQFCALKLDKLRMQMWLPASPGGLLSYLVTLHVLRLGSADFSVVGPGHPLRVAVGRYIVLPCHLSPSMDARSFEVRWIRHRVSEIVHHYRNGKDLYGDQMEEYVGRTELVRHGLSSGRLDLRISWLRPSDDGQYICTVRDGSSYGEATVDLEVSATGSVPQLSLEAYENGSIRVVCRSAGWYPQPEVQWKDPDGQHLPSVSQRHSSDARGLFDIEDVIIVTRNGDGNWSCVVRNSRLNQEQETSLHISAPFFHNAHPWMVGVGVLLALSVVFLGLGAYLWRRKVLQSRELGEQAALLEERAAELGKRDSALGRRDEELEERAAALGEQAALLEERAAELGKRDSALGRRDEELEERAAALEERAAELGRRDEELGKRDAEMAWRKFLLPHNPDMVTLDPDSAHSRLVLSADGRSVRRGRARQDLPDTPERFDTRCCVLGQEGFREGRHCWEVEVKGEVGGDSWWAVGVARESAYRKGYPDLSPEGGIWAVCHWKGQFVSLTSSPTSLSPIPRRLWVCLDCTQGLVTFIDAESGVEIFTFPPASFNAEIIRPWFWVGTEETELCLRDSISGTLCPPSIPTSAPDSPCPAADTARSPLLHPAGAHVPLCPAQAQGAGGQ
ncbi:butyrophilin subfamily 1 member A1-like isoform X2 [Grus americana]|uniref:butyrophilin subfamily 1 member A1-like isoform X2 n=1 Tax=Grus americana TaxID=9117 RepID=UPI002407E31D|nr:butyrophilin subfamily 1 member A1-like isoform X2 [Grus americana]